MSKKFRILFVGNSYTTRNDMPAMLAELVAGSAMDLSLETKVIAFGGASLAAHWNRGEAQKRLTEQKWDAVILQDQSTRPLRALNSMQEHVRLYVEAVRASESRPYLYMTWARRNLPDSQKEIAKAYMDLAEKTKTEVIPVGLRWEQSRRLRDDLDLYDPDESHPSAAGSYLSACAHLVSLFNVKPPDLSEYESRISEPDRRFIGELCWKAACDDITFRSTQTAMLAAD